MTAAPARSAPLRQRLRQRTADGRYLSWLGVLRLSLVQMGMAAMLVLADSTFNRVMVVELGLAAVLPGVLLGVYYAVQLSRPRLGYGSDTGGHRTPLIVGGLLVLAFGTVGAAGAILVMAGNPALGIALAVLAFILIGVGSGAAGTTVLVLAAKQAPPARRGPVASILWIMLIVGFILSSVVAGSLLDPFSLPRLVAITAGIAVGGTVLGILGVWGIERPQTAPSAADTADDNGDGATARTPFFTALREVWSEPTARLFTIFVFVSMLAYSAQDLILEPFGGKAFGMTPGETTMLTAFQNQGALMGMLLVGFLCRGDRFGPWSSLRRWAILGCLGSAAALSGLSLAGAVGAAWPLKLNIFLLGLGNGAFAIAAVGSMMSLAGRGRSRREGMRMGLWGGAQAIAMGAGKFSGAAGVDLVGFAADASATPYMTVFAAEAVLFVAAAAIAARLAVGPTRTRSALSDAAAADIGGAATPSTVSARTGLDAGFSRS